MKAVVLTIGTELLRAGRPDANSVWLVDRLLEDGVPTVWRAAVEDDVEAIAGLVRRALGDAELVVTTGGLGPTDDDRTREALAAAIGAPLERDPEADRAVAARFLSRGRTPTPAQSRQADRPRGAAWIENALGSAPGILIARDGRWLAALPGVPAEMKAMYRSGIVPRLSAAGALPVARRVLRVAGRPESQVDDAVKDLYATPQTETTILASAGTVELVITARGASRAEAGARLDALEAAIRGRLGRDLFGRDHDTLASVVGGMLAARGASVAVGESCTGGLLGGAITEVPGSSAWFRGGLVCYDDDLKRRLAEVPDAVLRVHGAVSEPVARALAAGARRAARADFGLGITGIAGPGGGTEAKPVGTVHVALDDGGPGRAVKLDWPGDRDLIRRRAVAVALDLLRRRLLDG